MADAEPVNPQRVIWEMSPLLPANAIVTCEADPAPTGLLGTTGCSRVNPHRFPVGWPRWARRCPTPSAPSSRIPTGR